ncbi:MAG: hypothetical protein P4L96_10195 [Rhodoferax sp.]|nr:hypothetical protein [Rhodoferax sp.]
MADGIGSATVAVFSAVCLGYLTQFVAEDFRRFRDGSALAAGLSGELSSYKPALPILRDTLRSWIGLVAGGRRTELHLRPFDRPVDVVFDHAVGKLGLLGSATVESVVFVYSNLRAFRMALEMVTTKGVEMSDEELRLRCEGCLQALERAAERAESLVPELQARAVKSFRPGWCWLRRP